MDEDFCQQGEVFQLFDVGDTGRSRASQIQCDIECLCVIVEDVVRDFEEWGEEVGGVGGALADSGEAGRDEATSVWDKTGDWTPSLFEDDGEDSKKGLDDGDMRRGYFGQAGSWWQRLKRRE